MNQDFKVEDPSRDRPSQPRRTLRKTVTQLVCGGLLAGTLVALFYPSTAASSCQYLEQAQSNLMGANATRQAGQLNLGKQCSAALALVTSALSPIANSQTPLTINALFIGNSGTDEISDGISSVFQGSGVNLTQSRFSIPGAPLSWLWHHQNSNGKEQSPLSQIRRLKPNHLTIMPIFRSPEGTGTPVSEDHIAKPKESPVEAGDIRIGSLFYAEALRQNADAHLWLYSVWPNNQDPKYQTATAWDAWGVKRYEENQVTRDGIAAATGGRVAIIPAAAGLGKLREGLQQTQQQFIQAHFEDGIHLNATGRYFVSLLFFAYTTGRNPATAVTDNGPLSAEVAAQYKQIAWQTKMSFPPTEQN